MNMRKLVIATAFVLVACSGRHVLSQVEQDNANYGALKYASGVAGSGVECSGQDSDGDGYVTCSYLPSKEATAKVEIVCSYESRQGGCKAKG